MKLDTVPTNGLAALGSDALFNCSWSGKNDEWKDVILYRKTLSGISAVAMIKGNATSVTFMPQLGLKDNRVEDASRGGYMWGFVVRLKLVTEVDVGKYWCSVIISKTKTASYGVQFNIKGKQSVIVCVCVCV